MLLGHEEASAQCANFTFCGAHTQRTKRIGSDLDHQFTVAQDHQTLLVIEAQVHRALGIQAQAAAVRQREVLTLTAPGVQVSQQRVSPWAARTDPGSAAKQAKPRDNPQRITARSLGLQQQLARFARLSGHPPIKRANGTERSTQSFLQRSPGLGMGGVEGQPGIEAFLQRNIRLAGTQAHHPVDRLLADGIKTLLAHNAPSLK